LSKKKPKILVCPLDWGIGHATRCVPVIESLIRRDVQVIIGAANRPLEFLRSAFPQLQVIDIPGPAIKYPENENMAGRMLISSPGILRAISKEHHELEEIINTWDIGAVISDNRFGMWSTKVPSVYITHQVMVKAPGFLKFLEPLLYRFHRKFIDRYTETWIPDLEGDLNLSGDLAHRHRVPGKAHFIGPLSRFQGKSPAFDPAPGNDRIRLLVMLSGPEPQRTIFEELIFSALKDYPENAVILRGLPGDERQFMLNDHTEVYPHRRDEEILSLVGRSERIICRPGYSTIMDLAALKRTALLVPTPGQTEQEYLAGYLTSTGFFNYADQKSLDKTVILNEPLPSIIMPDLFRPSLLEDRIDALLARIR
jgi:predicted glycosyltransferase